MTAARLGSVLKLRLPVWAEAMKAAATVGREGIGVQGGMGFEFELRNMNWLQGGNRRTQST